MLSTENIWIEKPLIEILLFRIFDLLQMLSVDSTKNPKNPSRFKYFFKSRMEYFLLFCNLWSINRIWNWIRNVFCGSKSWKLNVKFWRIWIWKQHRNFHKINYNFFLFRFSFHFTEYCTIFFIFSSFILSVNFRNKFQIFFLVLFFSENFDKEGKIEGSACKLREQDVHYELNSISFYFFRTPQDNFLFSKKKMNKIKKRKFFRIFHVILLPQFFHSIAFLSIPFKFDMFYKPFFSLLFEVAEIHKKTQNFCF